MREKNVKTLFVYPPNQLMDIETPRPDGSLGPLYLAAALEDAGFEADILDASVGPPSVSLDSTFYSAVRQDNGLIRVGMTFDALREYIAGGAYDIVAIHSNFTPQTRMALNVAAVAKEVNPGSVVLAGGVNARNLPDRFFRHGMVDAICLTEGERVMVQLAQVVARGGTFEGVPGIAYRAANGRIVYNPVTPELITRNLDMLPYPAWHKLPFSHYERIASPHGVLGSGGVRYAPVMTSRGCPFRCSFCHISMEKGSRAMSGAIGELRLKSVDRVIEELQRLRALGVSKLYIEDDSLLAKRRRVELIFEKVIGMGFSIADVNGVNLVHFQRRHRDRLVIDDDYLVLLYDAGFREIVFPVESGSQRILDTYATAKLNHATLDVVELVRRAVKIGITCPINMMIGFPDETEHEMQQSIELARRLVAAGAAYCTFFIPIPFPGSALYEMAVRRGWLDHTYDTDRMNWKNAVMHRTVVPPERIIELRDWAWRSVNTDEHIATRLSQSSGVRWEAGRANIVKQNSVA